MFSSFSITHADEKQVSEVTTSLIISLGISFIPLLLGFIALSLTEQSWGVFSDVFISGELYFYAMSLCGSIYVVSQQSNYSGNRDMRLWSGAFVITCGCFMALYVGQSSLESRAISTFHGIASILFLVGAIFLYFRVSVLANSPPPSPEEVNRERANRLTASLDPDYDQ